jgi:uncharacterized membrane protein
MQSRFSIGGHPIHPLSVTVPIGLFTWAFVANVIYLLSDSNQMWYGISLWTGIAAILTALGSSVSGFADYLTIAVYTTARGHATAHMLLNLTVIACYVVSTVLMLDDGALEGQRLTAAAALQAVGFGLLALSGYIGGEMVYRHHLAVIPENAEVADAELERHALPERRNAPRQP